MVYQQFLFLFSGILFTCIIQGIFSELMKRKNLWTVIPSDGLILELEYCPYFSLFCRQNHISLLTIHGLWPVNYTAINEEYKCTDKEIELNTLSNNLLRRMQYVWPSYNRDLEWFWKHEFTKHGWCYNLAEYRAPDPALYFRDTINFYDHLKIYHLVYYTDNSNDYCF